MSDSELLQEATKRGVNHTEHWELRDIKNAATTTNLVVSFDTAQINDSSTEGMSHRTLKGYEPCLSSRHHVGSACCKYENETLRKSSCIQKEVKYCRCRQKHSVLWVRRKNFSFQEMLSKFVRRTFSKALLPWHLKTWCKMFLQMGNGVPWWRSFAMLLFYVIMLTSSLSSADYYSDYVSLYMKIFSKSACDGDYLRIDCPEGTSIDVQSAMYGRKLPSTEMCPSSDWMEGSGIGKSGIHEDTNCEAKTGAECQDQRICRLLVHRRVFGRDPCPGTSKYLTVRYQCAPKDFHRQSECVGTRMLLRCRQDTVISVFKVTPREDNTCKAKTNATDCTMTKLDVFDDVSAKCHSKERCSYTLPTASCLNRARIIHTCVPKEFVTSELPSSKRLITTTTTTTSTTTTTTTAETTKYSTTQEASSVTVQSTVNTDLKQKGDSTTTSTSTSEVFPYETTTSKNHLPDIQGNLTATTASAQGQAVSNTTTSFQVSIDVTNSTKRDNDIIIHNEFPLITDQNMANVTQCVNCTNVNIANASGFYNMMMRLYTFFKENSDDFLIAVLLGVVAALLLTICILVFRCKKEEKTKDRQKPEENRPDNRQNEEERDTVPETEAPVEEDEHENMSLLGSILQRSVDSNLVTPRSKVKSETEEDEKDNCGPKSIFGKICCNCCCSNAPWQRTQILKRHRDNVYRVTHRASSSLDDEEVTSRFRSHESFPVFSRTEDNVDNRSPIPVLEDHVNRMEYPIVTSESVTSPPLTSQSQQQISNFRPISRNAQRHYSVTPEPDSQYRTQQSTFQPQVRHENQRSDPALNRYSVRQHHSVSQPFTAPTSPVINHHSNHMHVNGTQKLGRAYPASNPKALPVMRQSMLQTPHQAQTPQSPITPKYTPPPSQYYSIQQYPTFTEAYEQYDNAQQHNQMVVRRKQYPQRPQEYPGQSQYSHPHYGTPFSGYQPQNSYAGDHFVQAVARRTIPSNARTVDLAANARTVDLSHDNSLSRNPWLEIRRSSIYDNSLPRNSELFEFYQHQLHHQEMQHALQHELPGSRNLNHYYP